MKNKGKMTMDFLERLKPEYAADAAGVEANEHLRKTLAGTSATWSLH
jgi:hypothetical protein